jgi:hypothetical protein
MGVEGPFIAHRFQHAVLSVLGMVRIILILGNRPHQLLNLFADDHGKLPCDRDTRVRILADIMNWLMWQTGDSGTTLQG